VKASAPLAPALREEPGRIDPPVLDAGVRLLLAPADQDLVARRAQLPDGRQRQGERTALAARQAPDLAVDGGAVALDHIGLVLEAAAEDVGEEGVRIGAKDGNGHAGHVRYLLIGKRARGPAGRRTRADRTKNPFPTLAALRLPGTGKGLRCGVTSS